MPEQGTPEILLEAAKMTQELELAWCRKAGRAGGTLLWGKKRTSGKYIILLFSFKQEYLCPFFFDLFKELAFGFIDFSLMVFYFQYY